MRLDEKYQTKQNIQDASYDFSRLVNFLGKWATPLVIALFAAAVLLGEVLQYTDYLN